ncbi:TPA: hypothetical protein SMT94_001758 [Proteus mirabilis]
MEISKATGIIINFFDRVKIESSKLCFLKNTKSVINTNYNFEKVINKNIESTLSVSDFIKKCENEIGENKDSYLPVNNSKSEKNAALESNENPGNVNKPHTDKKEKVSKLPNWITSSGLEKLNTNEEIHFKKIKVRNFKNIIKKITSFMSFSNRVSLPINTDSVSFRLSGDLNRIDLDDRLKDNESFNKFAEGLNQIKNAFIRNINKVRAKKHENNGDADSRIKYYTLEKALEYKFINDLNKIEGELKLNLAKDKFEENYSVLPLKIKEKLEFILNGNINGDVDKLFSYNVVNELKIFLKENINDEHKSNKFDNIIMEVFDSVMGDEGKKEILEENKEEKAYIKKELAEKITKKLFNCLSKDNHFIGEEESFNKINKYISDENENICNYVSKSFKAPNDEVINALKNNFFNNIKSNDNGDDLLIRLFKNNSNNINYKWAQDAVVLLINYDNFSNQTLNIKKYHSDGVASIGGSGSHLNKLSSLQVDLQLIFNRLGLDANDLEKSKDEVMRKYFANYFEHI